MADAAFMSIKLSGGRFKEGELPLSTLADLASLQDMIIKVAKWLYKEKHGRKRSPSGFDHIYLKMAGLRSGSTVTEIGIDTIQTIRSDALVPYQEHFVEAANAIVGVIGLATQGSEHLNGQIPPQSIRYLKRVGRSLMENEAMAITSADHHTAHLTQQSHKILIRHFDSTEVRAMTVRGAVSAVDLKNMKFRLEPIHGAMIYCPFSEQHKGTVLKALASYKNSESPRKMRVRVQTTGTYDRQDRLQSVESVRSVDVLDPLDVHARLDEFRSLRDGWLEGQGVGPSHAGLDWLSNVFERYYPDDLQLPYTYPMADGGVSLEWSFGIRDIDIEVNLENCTGEWYVFHSGTKSGEEEKTVKLDKPDDWMWICQRLQDLMEQSEHG